MRWICVSRFKYKDIHESREFFDPFRFPKWIPPRKSRSFYSCMLGCFLKMESIRTLMSFSLVPSSPWNSFLHKFTLTKLLCTCDVISKLLAPKLRKLAKFPYFFGGNSNFEGRRIVGRISENIDRIHWTTRKPSVQKLCLKTGRNYGASKLKK